MNQLKPQDNSIDISLNRMLKNGNAETVLLIDANTKLPIGVMPMLETDTDYQWQLKCLESREKHPEWYTHENVEEQKDELKKWLEEHKPNPSKRYAVSTNRRKQILICE